MMIIMYMVCLHENGKEIVKNQTLGTGGLVRDDVHTAA